MISNQGTDICIGHGHSLWLTPELHLKMQAEHTLNMHGCVVDQKLPSLYMCSNACVLAAKVSMQVHGSCVPRFNLHEVQLALHKKGRNKGSKNDLYQSQ